MAVLWHLGPWVQARDGDLVTWQPPMGCLGGLDLRTLADQDRPGVGLFAASVRLDSDYSYLGDQLDARMDRAACDAWEALTGLALADSRSLLDTLWAGLTVGADPLSERAVGPITPMRDGVLRLYLPGLGLVRQQRFRGTADPAWAPVRRRLQEGYRRLRSQEIARASVEKREPVLHRKWLGTQARSLGLRVAELARLIPDDLPAETPLPPTTTLVDTFTELFDTALGLHTPTPSGGYTWSVVEGTWTAKASDMAVPGEVPSVALAQTALSSGSHYAQVAMETTLGAGRQRGPVARSPDGAALSYYAVWADPATIAEGTVKRSGGGARTAIGSGSGTVVADGDVLCIECDGSSITRWFDGVNQNTATDATWDSTNLYVGLDSQQSLNSFVDDFEASELAAPAEGGPLVDGGLAGGRLVA